MEETIKRLEDFASSWNGKEDRFQFEDGIFDAEDIETANAAIDLLQRI